MSGWPRGCRRPSRGSRVSSASRSWPFRRPVWTYPPRPRRRRCVTGWASPPGCSTRGRPRRRPSTVGAGCWKTPASWFSCFPWVPTPAVGSRFGMTTRRSSRRARIGTTRPGSSACFTSWVTSPFARAPPASAPEGSGCPTRTTGWSDGARTSPRPCSFLNLTLSPSWAAVLRLIDCGLVGWELWRRIPPLSDVKRGGGGGAGRRRVRIRRDWYGARTTDLLLSGMHDDLITRSDVVGQLNISDRDLDSLANERWPRAGRSPLCDRHQLRVRDPTGDTSRTTSPGVESAGARG